MFCECNNKLSVPLTVMKTLSLAACLLVATASVSNAATVLPLYDGLDGTINVPGSTTSFNESGFNIDLVIRPSSGASSTHFYFSDGGYVFGALGNTSEVDITQNGGGTFTYNSVVEWAFQGSSAALLHLQGYLGGTLVGSEDYSLSTPSPGYGGSYTSQLKSATLGGLSGVVVDELVMLPDFTEQPTQQSGFANLTLTVGAPKPPALACSGLQSLNGTNVVSLTWTNNGAACVLESSDALTGGWSTVSTPWVTNTSWVVTLVTNNSSAQFFRLRGL